MVEFWAALALTPGDTAALVLITFVAGLIRGFTGFALSAFALSTAVLILPPVELIPMLFWLEAGASILMARDGLRHAERRAALTLLAGGIIGTFFGVGLTVALDVSVSRIIALCLLISLALMQLSRVRVPWLATRSGTLCAGFTAGIANGLAALGGMVVALYVLARNAEPRVMRATLVLYLFLGMIATFGSHLWWGTMTQAAFVRGMTFIPMCLVGVLIGTRLFTPALQPYYRAICLWLLVGLAAIALFRTLVLG